MATMEAPVAAQPTTAQTSAEEAAQKKNTDCVYFLASPLTCKKGDECEFRHSEAARINPRDCWYWLSSNCLNRDCPFRHPPLDARAPAGQPVNSRPRAPCYYYAQGYCAKGDRCTFSHGVPVPPRATSVPENEKEAAKAEVNLPATKPVPVPKAVKKPFVDIQLQTVQEEKATPAQAVQVPKQVPPSAPAQNGSSKVVSEEPEASPEPLSSSHEDVHISDARAENGIRDPEDRWEESSPGFDVLVDDGPDQMHYGDEGEFHANHDEAGGHFDDDMEPYEFQYSEMYNQPGGYQAGSLYDHANFDRYDRLGYDQDNYEPGEYERGSYDGAFDRPDYDRPRFEHPEHMEREIIYRRSREGPPNGRTHSIKERLGFNYRESRPFLDNNDLRNHLERRRRLEPYARGDRSNREFLDRDRQREEYDRERDRRMQVQYPQGRANSRRSRERGSVDTGIRRFEPRSDVSETTGGFSHKSRGSMDSRRSARDASPTIHDSRNSGQGLRRNGQSDFAPPKSLAQIRAEKRKFDGDEVQVNSKRGAAFREGRLGNSNHREGEEFEGPKPLREILKEKGKLEVNDRQHRSVDSSGSEINNNITTTTTTTNNNNNNNFTTSHTTTNNHVLEEESPIDIPDTGDDLIDDEDDEDDEDDFAKKLGGFFS